MWQRVFFSIVFLTTGLFGEDRRTLQCEVIAKTVARHGSGGQLFQVLVSDGFAETHCRKLKEGFFTFAVPHASRFVGQKHFRLRYHLQVDGNIIRWEWLGEVQYPSVQVFAGRRRFSSLNNSREDVFAKKRAAAMYTEAPVRTSSPRRAHPGFINVWIPKTAALINKHARSGPKN